MVIKIVSQLRVMTTEGVGIWMNSRNSAFLHIRTERAAVQFRMSTSYHKQTFGTDVRGVKAISLRVEALPPVIVTEEEIWATRR